MEAGDVLDDESDEEPLEESEAVDVDVPDDAVPLADEPPRESVL